MKFRTEITPRKGTLTLSPERPAVMLGSCFADNIATRMRRSFWRASNPLGTLYNPLSIASAVRTALLPDTESDGFDASLFESGALVHSWLLDSRFTSRSREVTAECFRSAAAEIDSMLREGETLFVTFGTAICYFLDGRDEGESHDCHPVGNCHKQPSALFSRRRISVDEAARCWEELLPELRKLYPGLRVVFTVSPVRHLKDGAEENSRSKATLLLAIDRLCSEFDFCSYFPAYELLLDDLRDYRFYASDLAHPSEHAVDYIWDFFCQTYLDDEGRATVKEGESIRRALEHRPNVPVRDDEDRRQLAAFREAAMSRYRDFAARHHGRMLLP